MQNDRQRMFTRSQGSDQVVSDTRTKCRNNTKREKEKRHAQIELTDQQNAGESQRVENPLGDDNLFLQQKNGDNRRENRRQILNRHRRRERNVLHRDEEKIKRGRAEKSAHQ